MIISEHTDLYSHTDTFNCIILFFFYCRSTRIPIVTFVTVVGQQVDVTEAEPPAGRLEALFLIHEKEKGGEAGGGAT